MSSHQHSQAPNLWIGELDNWMDEKYLSEALGVFSKHKINNTSSIRAKKY